MIGPREERGLAGGPVDEASQLLGVGPRFGLFMGLDSSHQN